MTDPMASEVDVGGLERLRNHPWWCDCAGCWTGITLRASEPAPFVRRVLLAGRAFLLAEKEQP